VHAHALPVSIPTILPLPFAVPPPPPPLSLYHLLSLSSSVCLVLSLAVSSALFRSPARLLRARGAPLLDVPGFLRYRESFRVRLRATDYRNQATPGSGISAANYNHRFFSYVTSLFSCRFLCADVPTKRIPVAPRRAVDHGKACHSVAYTRDLSVCCAGSEICCETTCAETTCPR